MNKIYLILALLWTLGVHAQSSMQLSIAEARTYALEYNKSLKNADFDIEKSRQAIREASAALYPQIDAKVDYSNFLGAELSFQFSEMMPPQTMKFDPTSNFNLSVGQMIFNGQFWMGLKTAKLAKQLTEMSKEKSVLELQAQVNESYYFVLVSQELLNKLNINLQNVVDMYEKTKPLAEVGMMEQTEVDQLSVQVNMLRNALRKSERQLELAYNMLKLQLGIKADTEVELSTTLSLVLAAMQPELYLDNRLQLENHIDMRLMEHQLVIQKKTIDLKKAAALPTLNAFYQYSKKLLKPKFDMSPAQVLGLQLNIPIFSGFMRSAQVQQAKIEVQKTNNNIALLSDQLQIQETQLHFDFKNAYDAYINQKENVEVAKRVYSHLKNKYGQGMLSSLDLINADNNYIKAETDLISSIMSLLSAKNKLDKLYNNIR